MKKVYKGITAALMMLLFAGIGTLALNDSALAAGEVTLIVNEGVGLDSISAGDIKNIMLGKSKKWDDGTKVVIGTLKKGDVHEAFTTSIAGKTGSQFKSTWKKLVITGKGIQPKSFADEVALMEYVAKTKGAVGYVSAGTSLSGVKELAVN